MQIPSEQCTILTVLGELDLTMLGGFGGCDCLLRSKSVSIRWPLEWSKMSIDY